MKWLLSAVFSALWQSSNGHMSMQYPYPRDLDSGVSYAVWQQNEPMWSVHPEVCHGLDEDETVRDGNVFAAGDYVEIDIYGSAPHDGGHCAFWWTTDETSDWYKIIDYKDCTLADTFYVLMPYTMSTECATKCTFAFTWIPVSSGACEVYMNCAEVQVTGTTGPDEDEAIKKNIKTSIIDAASCTRVDDTTHWSVTLGSSTEELKTEYTTLDTNGGAVVVDDASEDQVITVDDTVISEEIDDESTLCANENAINIDGDIPNDGNCTVTGSRCDDGQCCSSFGFCGPELDGYDDDGNPQYVDYDSSSAGDVYYASADLAFAAYCNDGLLGDWRLVDCEDDNESSDDTPGSDSSVTRIGYNNNNLGIIGVIMLFVAKYCLLW